MAIVINEADLMQAITECQAERSPNAHTCMKLAAFYTILDHTTKGTVERSAVPPAYSFAPGPVEQAETQTEGFVEYDSGTEFSTAMWGKESNKAWALMDELMGVVKAIQPRLYAATLRKIDEL